MESVRITIVSVSRLESSTPTTMCECAAAAFPLMGVATVDPSNVATVDPSNGA